MAEDTYDADREYAIKSNTYEAGGKTWHLPRDTHQQLENGVPSAGSERAETGEDPWAHYESVTEADMEGVEVTWEQICGVEESEA